MPGKGRNSPSAVAVLPPVVPREDAVAWWIESYGLQRDLTARKFRVQQQPFYKQLCRVVV